MFVVGYTVDSQSLSFGGSLCYCLYRRIVYGSVQYFEMDWINKEYTLAHS